MKTREGGNRNGRKSPKRNTISKEKKTRVWVRRSKRQNSKRLEKAVTRTRFPRKGGSK